MLKFNFLIILFLLITSDLFAETFNVSLAKIICNPECGNPILMINKRPWTIKLLSEPQSIFILDNANRMDIAVTQDENTKEIIIDGLVDRKIRSTAIYANYTSFKKFVNYQSIVESGMTTWFLFIIENPILN